LDRPFGVAGSSASIVTGKILDWNYRRYAKMHGMPVDRKRTDDLRNFPIEKVRIQILVLPLIFGVGLVLAYGWCLDQNGPLAVSLVLLFFLGLVLTAVVNTMSTILVDLYPTKGATVTAANNFVRCLLSAGAVAVVAPVINAIGVGGAYSILAGLLLLSAPLLLLVIKLGPVGRERRRTREEQRLKK
jgi:MFS family permease